MKFFFLADAGEHQEFYIQEVASLIFKEWGCKNPGNRPQNTLERVRGTLNKDSLPTCIICTEGDPLLMGFYTLKSTGAANDMKLTPWLSSVYVKPEFRGIKIGTRLTQHALTLAGNLGYDNLYLTTTDKQSLYARVGFKKMYQVENRREVSDVMGCPTRAGKL